MLGRERQLTARELAGRVGEIVDGISAIHINDTSNYERADIGSRLGRIFKIRYDIYQWKFFVKFLNNFIAQVTPFLFYAIGGYLALQGRMDVGQLVAVIAAYKDLPSPIKDLIDWDQQRVDVQVKYTQVVEQFTVSDLLNPKLQEVSKDPCRKCRAISGTTISRPWTKAAPSSSTRPRSRSRPANGWPSRARPAVAAIRWPKPWSDWSTPENGRVTPGRHRHRRVARSRLPGGGSPTCRRTRI